MDPWLMMWAKIKGASVDFRKISVGMKVQMGKVQRYRKYDEIVPMMI